MNRLLGVLNDYIISMVECTKKETVCSFTQLFFSYSVSTHNNNVANRKMPSTIVFQVMVFIVLLVAGGGYNSVHVIYSLDLNW